MELRQIHEIMLGSQRIKIYTGTRYEPVFIRCNSSIEDAILDEQIEFIFTAKGVDDCIIIQLERRY